MTMQKQEQQPTKEEIKASIFKKLKTYDNDALDKIATHHEVHYENCIEEADFHRFVIQKVKSIQITRAKQLTKK